MIGWGRRGMIEGVRCWMWFQSRRFRCAGRRRVWEGHFSRHCGVCVSIFGFGFGFVDRMYCSVMLLYDAAERLNSLKESVEQFICCLLFALANYR